MTGALFLLLFLPPLVMAVAGVWAAVTGLRSLWEAVQLLGSWQVGNVGTLLPSLNAASRLALLGVSFFAILFALIVFMGGTFGRGWRHLFLVPGVILTAPSLVVFVQSARLTSILLTQLGVARPLQVLGFAYLLLDALLLALLMTDVRPRRRRRSKMQRLPQRDSRDSRPHDGEPLESVSRLPVEHFDLSSPFEEVEAKTSVAVVETQLPPTVTVTAVEAEPEDTRSEVTV
jgi:hypothetical protein